MGHIEGQSRHQGLLFPEVLDELVPAEDPVRVVDAFVDSLKLQSLGFAGVVSAETGRPAYHPGDLLKLYVYGYLNQVRSSRRLQRECERNIEVLWLLNRLRPSFKTIADFRRDHVGAIVGVCRAFTRFCREQGLFAAQVVAIDGTKLQAVASRKRVMTPERIEREQAKLDARIAEYLKAMDAADAEESSPVTAPREVATALEALRARREELQSLTEQMQAEEANQHIEGEADARLMRTAQGHRVAYNAQIAVDAQHKLIAYAEVTNEGNDHRQLQPMAAATKEQLQAEHLTVVADTGYANGEQGSQCEQAGITAIVPRPQEVNPKGDYFTRSQFDYDLHTDTYRCPAGQILTCGRTSQTLKNKQYWTRACGTCALKARCTGADKRVIVRSFFEEYMEAMHQRALSDPQWMRQRCCLAEHPFGTMKWMMGVPRFLLRGLPKVRGEFALSVLTYNLKRVINILGVRTLLERLKAVAAPQSALVG